MAFCRLYVHVISMWALGVIKWVTAFSIMVGMPYIASLDVADSWLPSVQRASCAIPPTGAPRTRRDPKKLQRGALALGWLGSLLFL